MEKYPPRNKETVRPFRLWDPQKGEFMVGRMYAKIRTAHDRATVLVRWMAVGTSIEVLDVRVAAWRGTYSRKVGSIKIEMLRGVDSERAKAQG